MATTTFTAASLIFVTIWLEAVVSFSVVASSLFLYILGSVDASIGPSLAISLSCVSISNVGSRNEDTNKRLGNTVVSLPHLAVRQC